MRASAEVQSEFISDRAPFRECHASTLVEIREGDLLAAWYGGTKEGASDAAIWLSRHSRGRWSAPQKVAREEGVPTWNPVLFRDRQDRIWLFYKVAASPEVGAGASKISIGQGATRGGATHLPAGLLGPLKNKPIRLAGGDILAGTSLESYKSWAAWVERSSDEGKMWTRHGPVAILLTLRDSERSD